MARLEIISATEYSRQFLNELWTILEKPNPLVDFIPIDRRILALSRDVVIQYHFSADDAVHLYTAYATECECFIFKDDKLKKATGGNVSGMPLLDITSHADMNPLTKSFDSRS